MKMTVIKAIPREFFNAIWEILSKKEYYCIISFQAMSQGLSGAVTGCVKKLGFPSIFKSQTHEWDQERSGASR